MSSANMTCTKLDKIKRVIIPEEEIKTKLRETGKLISKEYEGKPLLLVSILRVLLYLWLTFAVKFPFRAK